MTHLPRRLLVGTDFSPASEHAIARAIELARAWSACITLYHVVSTSFWDDVLDRVAGAADPAGLSPASAAEAADAALRQRAARIRASTGIDCDAAAASGRAAAELARAAGELGAGLIVVGARGAHPVRELLLGTTAQKLLRVSHCAVLVVKRAPAGAYRTVLAPTDFSPPSRAALQACVHWLRRTMLHVAHAFELPYDGLARYAAVDTATMAPYYEAAQTQLHARLLAFADQAGVPAARRVLHVEHGYAPTCIERWAGAAGADLVAIAAHGKSELEATLLGSVSLHTVQAVDCDVLLWRGPELG